MQKAHPRIGGRVQRLRRQKGLSQAQLATALGISASYLNLIEHNRRRMTVGLLLKLAHYFGVDAGELAESDQSQLAGDLMELFGNDLFADLALTNHDIQDLSVSHSKVGQAIVRLFDNYMSVLKKSGSVTAVTADPNQEVATDAVADFLQENKNHFPSLEAVAARVRRDVDRASDSLEHGLRSYLLDTYGYRWRAAPLPDYKTHSVDPRAREIITADVLPPESAVFIAAQQLGCMAVPAEINQLLDGAEVAPEAEPLARDALAAYFAAALVMPYAAFHRACEATRYDVERIGRLFKVSFEQVCHRMTTLQRPGLTGLPVHLVRTDIAGNISKRFSLSGIHIPRHSGACPRWNVYSAFMRPDQILVQISEMPDGQRYLCIAKLVIKGGYRHNAPRRYMSIGLGWHIEHAPAVIYSEGLDLANRDQVVEIGVACRVCPRQDCGQRAHPALKGRIRSGAEPVPALPPAKPRGGARRSRKRS